jgi:hypothetical protein
MGGRNSLAPLGQMPSGHKNKIKTRLIRLIFYDFLKIFGNSVSIEIVL